MKTVHICDICNTHYDTWDEAVACENQKPRDMLDGAMLDTYVPEIGDLVSCGGHYSWWDGSEQWRFKMDDTHEFYKFAHRGGEFKYLYHPLWVVVDIKQDDRHILQYILATTSNASGHPSVASTCCQHNHMVGHGKAPSSMRDTANALYDPAKHVEIV